MIHAQFSVIKITSLYFVLLQYFLTSRCSCMWFQKQHTVLLLLCCDKDEHQGLVRREDTWCLGSSYINTLIQEAVTSSCETDWPRSTSIISIQVFSVMSWHGRPGNEIMLAHLSDWMCNSSFPLKTKSGTSSTMTWRGFRYWWIHYMCTKETKGE